jgi:predicted 2-oxoglutarate/Fe(II)-dependent dioxygenase YbiX
LTEALFTQTKTISSASLEDIKYFKDTVGDFEARVTKSGGGVYKDIRKAQVKEIKHTEFPDICEAILDLVPIHRPNLFKSNFEVREFNYLMYEQGGHFVKHKDYLHSNNGDKFANRVYSTITLIDKSNDLEGGDLLIWNENGGGGTCTKIELDVGETVIFNSAKFHQVTPIIRGTREALVAWIYLRK